MMKLVSVDSTNFRTGENSSLYVVAVNAQQYLSANICIIEEIKFLTILKPHFSRIISKMGKMCLVSYRFSIQEYQVFLLRQ